MFRSPLIDVRAAEANRKRLLRRRAEEEGRTLHAGTCTRDRFNQGGVHKPKETAR